MDRTTSAATQVAGLLLVALAAAFLTVIMLAASIAPGYDVRGGAISDLGTLPETSMLFNATLVTIGLLDLAAGYLLWRWHRRAWIFGMFAVAGIGAVGAGVFPLTTGTPHAVFALLAFVFFNVQVIAVATLLRGPARVLSAVAGVVGLAYVVLMVIGDGGNPSVFGAIGHGGSERMIVYPVMLCLLALGGYFLGARPEAIER
jgi:hypothetical membrane protein